jgi:hypothetical protein
MHKLYSNVILTFVLFAYFIPFSLLAKSAIHFTEYHILLTENEPNRTYPIFNQGDSAAFCEAKFIDYIISADGSKRLATKDQLSPTSAQSILRVSPRRVTIPPLSSQKLKVAARGLRKQRDSEWVSYLSLSCKDKSPDVTAIGITILPSYTFNIPTIVRKGQLNANLTISKAEVVQHSKNTKAVELVLSHSGERSVYGNILIKDAEGNKIGALVNVSVYQEESRKTFNIVLKKAIKGNEITISFTEHEKYGGSQLANYELSL